MKNKDNNANECVLNDGRGDFTAHEPRRDIARKGEAIWRKLEAQGVIDAYNNRGQALDALVRDFLASPGAIILVASAPGRAPTLQPHPAPFEELTTDEVAALLVGRHV